MLTRFETYDKRVDLYERQPNLFCPQLSTSMAESRRTRRQHRWRTSPIAADVQPDDSVRFVGRKWDAAGRDQQADWQQTEWIEPSRCGRKVRSINRDATTLSLKAESPGW